MIKKKRVIRGGYDEKDNVKVALRLYERQRGERGKGGERREEEEVVERRTERKIREGGDSKIENEDKAERGKGRGRGGKRRGRKVWKIIKEKGKRCRIERNVRK